TDQGGKKILISGGGRCNVLPSISASNRFVTSSNQRILQSILKNWSLGDQRAFFERDLGIPLVIEPETGKLFPAADRARVVRDGLMEAARRLGVAFRFGTRLVDLERAPSGWVARTDQGPIETETVVLATGGLSVPTTGSNGVGLEVAKRLGHVIM